MNDLVKEYQDLTQQEINQWDKLAREFKDVVKYNNITTKYEVNQKAIDYFLTQSGIVSIELYFYISLAVFIKFLGSYRALEKEYDKCNGINGCKRQQQRVKNGYKPAYNYDITADTIIELKKRGMSYKQIAKELNTSRSTLWRRLKEENKSNM